jgi:predicted nucleic acid-binding Zn ribbon protein
MWQLGRQLETLLTHDLVATCSTVPGLLFDQRSSRLRYVMLLLLVVVVLLLVMLVLLVTSTAILASCLMAGSCCSCLRQRGLTA